LVWGTEHNFLHYISNLEHVQIFLNFSITAPTPEIIDMKKCF